MKNEKTMVQIWQTMLRRSMYVLMTPVMLVFALLACGTAVSETASYICPTGIPPTDGPVVTYLPGTPVPFPTPVPPTPTPYQIQPPQDFYAGDAVFVGQTGAARRLRFRLHNVQKQGAAPLHGNPRNLYTWSLEIRNLGSEIYETIPVALMGITRVTTASGEQTGTWNTSDVAMKAAGITGENYDPLMPGETRVYRLAAFAPTGNVRQFTYLLDGDGSNRITWANAANPYCTGHVAD